MSFKEYYDKLNPNIKEYFNILSPRFPEFIIPFIETETMMRLNDISYFCGMEYGSKKVYDFTFPVSRLDHSISTALITWNFTYDPKQTLAALFHDASTPAFSHVIDYMNGDYVKQESTEINLTNFLSRDEKLIRLLFQNGIKIDKVSNFKDYSIVDNDRPKLCADRLDCLFIANLAWTKETTIEEIKKIYNNLCIKTNEQGNEEFSFIDLDSADRAVELNEVINIKTHTDDDYVSMNLLAEIVQKLIDNNFISYDELFNETDSTLMRKIERYASFDAEVDELLNIFKNLSDCHVKKAPIKNKVLDPLVLSKRYSSFAK